MCVCVSRLAGSTCFVGRIVSRNLVWVRLTSRMSIIAFGIAVDLDLKNVCTYLFVFVGLTSFGFIAYTTYFVGYL